MKNRTNGKQQLSFVCCKQNTETSNFRSFAANRKRKRKFVFLGQQMINSNQRFLLQQTCPSMDIIKIVYSCYLFRCKRVVQLHSESFTFLSDEKVKKWQTTLRTTWTRGIWSNRCEKYYTLPIISTDTSSVSLSCLSKCRKISSLLDSMFMNFYR
jgi:hypothetical protein